PIRGFPGVAGAIAFRRRSIKLVAIAQEIDAVEGFGAHTLAKVGEFVCTDAVGLFAAPVIIPHPRTLGWGTDSFAPVIIPAEEPSEPYRAGPEVAHHVDEVLTPIVHCVV